MGSIPGYKKGNFPGKWHIEKANAAHVIISGCPTSEKFDRLEIAAILDMVAPTESDWRFLSHRACVIDDAPSETWTPNANAWRQALLESFAWGQNRSNE